MQVFSAYRYVGCGFGSKATGCQKGMQSFPVRLSVAAVIFVALLGGVVNPTRAIAQATGIGSQPTTSNAVAAPPGPPTSGWVALGRPNVSPLQSFGDLDWTGLQ